jgi:transcriptional regulator GlxA family with amidase domain
MKIAIIGYYGCLGQGFIRVTDLLKMSQNLMKNEQSEPYQVVTVTHDGQPFYDGFGRNHDVEASFATEAAYAAIIVPPFLCNRKELLPAEMNVKAIAGWLRRQHSIGAIVAGSCNGVLLLGEAGLLDGRRCTTAWWRHDELRVRFPRADPARGAPLIEDGRIITASGPLSWIDLSLHVIRRLCGPEASKKAADFTIDAAPSMFRNAVPTSQPNSDRFILEAEHVVRQAGEAPITTTELARALKISERTLYRRLKEATGEAPKQFLDRLRVDAARMLLETTHRSIKQLASATGYADEGSFRRVFRRHSGMTPSEYRSWAIAQRGIGYYTKSLKV